MSPLLQRLQKLAGTAGASVVKPFTAGPFSANGSAGGQLNAAHPVAPTATGVATGQPATTSQPSSRTPPIARAIPRLAVPRTPDWARNFGAGLTAATSAAARNSGTAAPVTGRVGMPPSAATSLQGRGFRV